MIAARATTGPGLPLGWIVAGASGVGCKGCGASLFLRPESMVLWPVEIGVFLRAHAGCAWPNGG